MSYQSGFILKYSVLHDEKGKKINISEPITAPWRQSGSFFVVYNGSPPIPSLSKMQAQLHEF